MVETMPPYQFFTDMAVYGRYRSGWPDDCFTSPTKGRISNMARILILGPGVQGTLYGVRLALAGHNVTFVARGKRAEELKSRGAIIARSHRDASNRAVAYR